MRYRVGKCDFPWAYNSRCTHSKTRFGGGVHSQYSVISDEEALTLWAPWIGSLFDPQDAICFFWIVWPKLPFCIRFIEACGFEVKTNGFTWVKKTKKGKNFSGVGSYTASNSEACLIGVRGSITPQRRLVASVADTYIDAHDWDCVHECVPHQILRHSEKPLIFTERIDQMYPVETFGRAIGLFERESQGDRWDIFGDQVQGSIPGPEFGQPAHNFTPWPYVQLPLFQEASAS